MKKIFFGSIVVAFWLLLCAAVYLFSWLHTPINQDAAADQKSINFELKAGDSVSSVARDLKKLSLLSYPRVFILYARLVDKTGVKLGEYQLPLSETPIQLLDRLIEGDVLQYSVTLVEGTTFRDALNTLAQHPKVTSNLKGVNLVQLASRLGLEQNNPEGWVFPSTYSFTKGVSDWSLIERFHKQMKSVLEAEWQNREKSLPYNNAYEALIMASIIERETGAAHERAEIAGVFVRRLEKRMRLQTDPTVIYGMGDTYNGKIRRADLRKPTPYNTYVINGLPPTPIALPGREAIHAALHPAQGSSLYFVARGDGTHKFSATLVEHEAAVSEFQINRKSGYRSSPEKLDKQ